MEDARSLLPSHYTFSASPADMALSLASAAITVITVGEESPYYGVLEFPIHREAYQLHQVHAVRVSGAEEPTIMGEFEIDNLLLAVSSDKHFLVDLANVQSCLPGLKIKMDDPRGHFCTPVTSVDIYDPNVPPGSCAAAIYYESKFVSDICPQAATLSNRTIFTHVQQNQWTYSGPLSAHFLRVFCPPRWEETHSSVPLSGQGGLLQIPEGCSGKYGSVILPATFKVRTRFQVTGPVHRPFPRPEANHWHPIIAKASVEPEVLEKVKESLGNSSQLKMPLRQYAETLTRLKSEFAKSKLHRIYHSPAFAPTLSVSTVVLVIIGVGVIVVMVRRMRARRFTASEAPRPRSPAGSAHPELFPLQALPGPAGATPFPTPIGRRPLPAPPVTIREVSEDDLEENQPRSSQRVRRTRNRGR